MAQRYVDPTTLTKYGMSRQRSSFTNLEGAGNIDSSGTVTGGALMVLATDLTTSWTMYNGNPIVGNEMIDSVLGGANYISKQFFTQLGVSGVPYSGIANFTEISGNDSPKQHVLLFNTTNSSLPNNGTVSRGIDQNYRLRFELDMRPRLYFDVGANSGDREFPQELYQLNLRQSSRGMSKYATLFIPDQYHPGYNFNGSLANGWELNTGIPNPSYGWLKVNSGTANQLLADGSISNPQLTQDGLISLPNGIQLDTAVLRNPGEMVDLHFEDITIVSDPANSGPYFVYGLNDDVSTHGNTQSNYFPVYLDQTAANAADTTAGGAGGSTVHTFNEYPLATFYIPNTGSTLASATAPATTDNYTKYINNRSVRFRNKRKGSGWFKRYPKTEATIAGSYPFSYRLTMTERGVIFYMYDDAAGDQADDYAWMCIQRTVNNESGLPRGDEASKFPVHAMYSCSRESFYSSDAGVFFSNQAANLQTAADQVNSVFDEAGNQLNLSNIDNTKTFYILSPFDREDYLADEYTAKNIWRFVVREFDILKPQDVHKFATRHQIDSNAVINPLEQLAITDENRFVITFPTGLTTQRFMYPKEEMDLICFSSAEVVAESSNIPMTTYLYDGTNPDLRRYQGMRSTAAFGNGMRIMVLVNSQYIFNTDTNLDTYEEIGTM
jgi:hypothetical protein